MVWILPQFSSRQASSHARVEVCIKCRSYAYLDCNGQPNSGQFQGRRKRLLPICSCIYFHMWNIHRRSEQIYLLDRQSDLWISVCNVFLQVPFPTHLGKEQLWFSLDHKSQLMFLLPPGLFHQIQKLIWLFAVHLEYFNRWVAPVLDERQMFTFWARLCFALSQERALRRDTGPKVVKCLYVIPSAVHMWHLW